MELFLFGDVAQLLRRGGEVQGRVGDENEAVPQVVAQGAQGFEQASDLIVTVDVDVVLQIASC
ncbi:hypothetical protein D3C84_1086210 [compost metagenome]